MSFGSASTRSSSGSTPAPVSRAGRKEINHHVAVYRYAPLPPTSSKRRLLRSPFYSPPLFCHRRILCGVRAGEERRRWTAFFTFENLVNHVHGAINHFPIALLFVSAGFDLFAGEEVKACASVRGFCWRSVLSGPSHPLSQGWWRTWPTSDPVFASAIEVHQYTAFAAPAIFAALAACAGSLCGAARTSGVPGRTWLRLSWV